MKPKSIEDLLERVKSWPPSAQADLAQVALGIEADLERGVYGETYIPTEDEREALKRALQQAENGEFASEAEVEATFAKYRRS